MYLKERNGIWYIYEYDAATGQCRKSSTRTRDRSAAEKILAKRILSAPSRKQSDDVTVLQVVLRYWELYGRRLFARNVVRGVLGMLAEHAPTVLVRSFDVPMQLEFAANIRGSNNSRRRYMGVIAAALRWSVNRGELASIPHLHRVATEETEGVRAFTVDELRELCKAAKAEHEQRFVLLCIATAARPSATLDVSWDRFNADTRVLDYDVPGRKKTKKRRARVALAPTAAAYLEARRSIGPIIKYGDRPMSTYKMTFQRIAARAGIAGTAYSIRKGVSTWMRGEGVPEWDIQGTLGHSVGISGRYAHFRPEYMRAAAESIERLLVELNPPWLSSYWPVPVATISRIELEPARLLVSVGGVAGDRTLDQFLKREIIDEPFQCVKAANDD